MTSFSDALKKAGIPSDIISPKDESNAHGFTLEMKLYEMQNHITAMKRIYQKYLVAEGDDKFDYMDSLANRFGYMVIAFQDIMTTIGRIDGHIGKNEELSIRRSITEFQALFEDNYTSLIDDAIVSFSDRNEIVHVYENYKGNMETVLENVSNYLDDYANIQKLLWNYAQTQNILSQL